MIDGAAVSFSDFCVTCSSQEFDRSYGPGWQCIVGTDFGSFVTHHSGCFIYFGIGNLAILLFNAGEQARLTAVKPAV